MATAGSQGTSVSRLVSQGVSGVPSPCALFGCAQSASRPGADSGAFARRQGTKVSPLDVIRMFPLPYLDSSPPPPSAYPRRGALAGPLARCVEATALRLASIACLSSACRLGRHALCRASSMPCGPGDFLILWNIQRILGGTTSIAAYSKSSASAADLVWSACSEAGRAGRRALALASGDHPMRSERYRDCRGPCARTTRTSREEYTVFLNMAEREPKWLAQAVAWGDGTHRETLRGLHIGRHPIRIAGALAADSAAKVAAGGTTRCKQSCIVRRWNALAMGAGRTGQEHIEESTIGVCTASAARSGHPTRSTR